LIRVHFDYLSPSDLRMQRIGGAGWEIFDLSKDIGQPNNRAAQHRGVVKRTQSWQRWDL
jgi:hypothetical protein